MKKSAIFGLVAAIILSNVSVMACVDDYTCDCDGYYESYDSYGYGESCGVDYTYDSDYQECYIYDESSTYNQPLYCPYCGNETWACVCGTGGGYIDQGYYSGSYSSYSCSSGVEMDHWANVRNECGDVIGRVGAGENVTVLGIDCDEPDRVMVYDSDSGVYGSVLASCVYGGYVWDGNGCTEAYTSSQGYCGDAIYANQGYCSGSYSEPYDNCYIDQGYYDGGYANDCSSYDCQETCSGGCGSYDNCYVDTSWNDCSGNCYSDSYYYDTYGNCSYYDCSAYQDSCNWDGGYICDYATSCSYTVRYIEIVQIVEVYEPMVRSCFGRGTMMGCNI